MTPSELRRRQQMPVFLSAGFRPFFLLASLYAGLAILAWLPMLQGRLALPTLLAARDWHVHEMLYGFLPAVVTGFLLTAIPNWTGRLPLGGRPLLILVAAWVAGRAAVTFSEQLGALAAALIDLSFLGLVLAAAIREIVAGRNWRNLKVVLPVGLLLLGNAAFHLEAYFHGTADYGIRLGLAAVLLLLMLIGGRIVPSFTRNWLARENPGRLPAPFGRVDQLSIAGAIAGLFCWVAAPESPVTGGLLILAGLLQAVRLARWAGDRTMADRLVLVLHIAYAFVPIGFVLGGLAAFGYAPPSAGIHAWAGGAVGAMTLAVMSRAALGHTGRSLIASRSTEIIYALVIVAACARIGAALVPAWSWFLYCSAGLCWSAAFLGFALGYWRVLTGPAIGR